MREIFLFVHEYSRDDSERDQKRWIRERYHTYTVIYLELLYCDPGSYTEIPIDEFMVIAPTSQRHLDFADKHRISVIDEWLFGWYLSLGSHCQRNCRPDQK